MRKKVLLCLIVLMGAFFAFNTDNVYALGTEVKHVLDEGCAEGIISPDVQNYLQQIFTIIKYLGPVLCVCLTMVDFVKAAASQNKDALQKAGKTAGKRIFFALLLFFIPSLVDTLFTMLGWYGTCGIS